jgi:LysR family transcriptional regulator, low CO2-responsive transcriptional regulator
VNVNHQHLHAFHVIAMEGSISRAARRLNMAQPTLSQQLKALESRHQAALFTGRKPPLRLTALGQQLFDLTQKLFQASQDVENLLRDPERRVTTQICPGSDSPFFAVRLAAAIRSRNPATIIRVRNGNAVETFSWLRDGKIDVGIVSDPPGDNAFAYEPLFSDRLIVAIPKSHPLAKQSVFPLSALACERLLLREPTSRTRTAIEELLLAFEVRPAEVMELHTRETIREGIAIGLGVGIFFSLDCPPDNRICLLPLDVDFNRSRLTGYVVCLSERRRSPLMRSVMDAAGELRTMSPLPVCPLGSDTIRVPQTNLDVAQKSLEASPYAAKATVSL